MFEEVTCTHKISWTQIRSDQIIAAYDAVQVEKKS